MDSFTDEQLLDFNRQGLIPGPEESEADFLKRCHYCLQLKANMGSQLSQEIPFLQTDPLSEEILKEAFPKTKQFYAIEPSWIPLFFSNYKLSPWHGGCAWIFQQHEDSPTGAFFQLRQEFRNSKKYLTIYRRDELIAHELVHVGRMMFQEPKFEEILAYRSSGSTFRRFLGPLVGAAWESALFVFVLFFIFILDLSIVFMGRPEYYQAVLWLKLLPLALILGAFIRLTIRQRQFKACLKRLQEAVGDDQKGNAIAFRLQDKEIIAMGKWSKEQILDYAKLGCKKSLRWKLIAQAYF